MSECEAGLDQREAVLRLACAHGSTHIYQELVWNWLIHNETRRLKDVPPRKPQLSGEPKNHVFLEGMFSLFLQKFGGVHIFLINYETRLWSLNLGLSLHPEAW